MKCPSYSQSPEVNQGNALVTVCLMKLTNEMPLEIINEMTFLQSVP